MVQFIIIIIINHKQRGRLAMDETHESQTTNDDIQIDPDAPQTNKMIDYLLRHANCAPIDEMAQFFNITDSGIRSAIGRIRAKANNPYQFTLVNKVIKTKVRGKLPTQADIIANIKYGNEQIGRNPGYHFHHKTNEKKDESPQIAIDDESMQTGHELYDNIIQMIIKNPDGIKTVDITKTLKISKQQLFNSCYAIRTKGINIVNKSGIYYIKPGPVKINHSKNKREKNRFLYRNNEVVKAAPKTKISGFIPPEYQTAFENLPENDKVECINLIKKAMYYKNAAIALMEANQTAFDFCSTLTKGIF